MARASIHPRRDTLAIAILLAVVVAVIIGSPNPGPAQPPHLVHGIGISEVATQLGVGLAGGMSGELAVGVSFTGTANDPAKLEALGIHGIHKGARVTVVRISEDKIFVEADELDPKPLRVNIRLKISPDGTLGRG